MDNSLKSEIEQLIHLAEKAGLFKASEFVTGFLNKQEQADRKKK